MQSNAETRRAATKDYVETISNYLRNSSQNGQGNFNPSGYSGSWNPDIGSPSYASSPTPSAIMTAIASYGTSKYNSGDTAGYNRAYNEYYMPRYNAGKADGIGIARQYVQQVKSTLSDYSSSYVSSFYSGSTWNSGNSISATSPTPSQMASAINALASDQYSSGRADGYADGKQSGQAAGLAVAKEYVTGIGEFLKGKGSAYTPAGYPGTSWNETSAKNPTPSQITAAIESYANSKVSSDLGSTSKTITSNGTTSVSTKGTGGYYSSVNVTVNVPTPVAQDSGPKYIVKNTTTCLPAEVRNYNPQTGAFTGYEDKSAEAFYNYDFRFGIKEGMRIGVGTYHNTGSVNMCKQIIVGPWHVGNYKKVRCVWALANGTVGVGDYHGDEKMVFGITGADGVKDYMEFKLRYMTGGASSTTPLDYDGVIKNNKNHLVAYNYPHTTKAGGDYGPAIGNGNYIESNWEIPEELNGEIYISLGVCRHYDKENGIGGVALFIKTLELID